MPTKQQSDQDKHNQPKHTRPKNELAQPVFAHRSYGDVIQKVSLHPALISSSDISILHRIIGNQAIQYISAINSTAEGTPTLGNYGVGNKTGTHNDIGGHHNGTPQVTPSKKINELVKLQTNTAAHSTATGANLVQRQEVGNQFYAHGAFMGAARQMLNDSKWNRILETLMPDVYKDVQNVTAEDDLISMFENNPVMAAYGMMKTQQLDQSQAGGHSDRIRNMQAIEWDVFLDPDIIRAYSVSFDAATEQALDKALVDTMIIAHGTTWQTIKENKIGLQYDAVKETRKTSFGGARSGAWMDIFGRAIRLASADNGDELIANMGMESRHATEDDQSLDQTFEQQMAFEDVIDLYKEIFGKDSFSVLLDLKSRNTKPWVLSKLTSELNRRGVYVYGIGTFIASELNNLDELNQRVDGQDMGAPRRIKFFHGIGNLQTACTEGEVFNGDTVMFNAGSILDSVDWNADTPNDTDAAIEDIIRNLGELKNTYRFHLGLHVQEGSASLGLIKKWKGADQRAVSKITDFSNRHADIFDLGFAWGGISNDMGRVRSGDSGIGSQSELSNNWDDDVELGAAPSTGFDSTFSIQRFLKSRHFEVKRGRVDVMAQAEWDSDDASASSYTITLRQSNLLADSTYTPYRFLVGKQGHARWKGLEDGTYYVEIDVADQEHSTLNGDITVGF